jgi:hypothetical protein
VKSVLAIIISTRRAAVNAELITQYWNRDRSRNAHSGPNHQLEISIALRVEGPELRNGFQVVSHSATLGALASLTSSATTCSSSMGFAVACSSSAMLLVSVGQGYRTVIDTEKQLRYKGRLR